MRPVPGCSLHARVVEFARELGYHDADALQAEADDALRAIREALKETPAE